MPKAQPGKRPFSALLTEDAYARLEAFASDRGTDKVALLEAICQHLADERLPRWLTDVVVPEARATSSQRRRRSKS